MSTNNPMTREQLNAIQARVNSIRARWDAITGNHSWPNYPWPDPTNERIKELEKENAKLRKRLTVDDAMVERVARATTLWSSHRRTTDEWGRLSEASRELWRMTARVALEAALNTREDA